MATEFTLVPVPPFRLDLTVWALRRRPANEVDRWDGETYRRALSVADATVEVAVREAGKPTEPELVVSVATDTRAGDPQEEVAERMTRMLGLDVDLSDFYRRAEGDGVLGPLVRRWRGLKPPRFPTVFECLVNAVACQQLTLTVGIVLLNRLARAIGPVAPGGSRAFPRPPDLADADPGLLRSLGFSRAKVTYLRELGDRARRGRIAVDALESQDVGPSRAALEHLHGIGRWSAEYTLLRGLGRLDVFPADDVGARNNLHRLVGLELDADYERVRQAVARWAPYSGLVYFHLLLDRLEEAGSLSTDRISSGQARERRRSEVR